MYYEQFQSASLAAFKTALGNSSFDVQWEHTIRAGYMRNRNYYANLIILNDFVQSQHVRNYEDGNGQYVQYQVVNHNLTVQYSVFSNNQNFASSSIAIANKVRSSFALDEIQDLFREAYSSPHSPGPIIQLDEVTDHQRWGSQAVFELSFNVRTTASIPDNATKGWVQAIEYSGSLESFNGQDSCPISDLILGDTLTEVLDEGLIPFNWETEVTQDFAYPFIETPDAVVLSIYPDNPSSGDVLIMGETYNTASLTVKTSAPWSGSIRYRAIWSDSLPTYPIVVTSSLDAHSGALSASAGTLDSSGLTGSPRVDWFSYWNILDQNATEFQITYWDQNNGNAIPYIFVHGFDDEEASGSLAAPFPNPDGAAGKLDHIAWVSGSS